MITGTVPVCNLTGFVAKHAEACVPVAERMETVILFREPGKSAQSLIADNYAMKGFRIDTKSCTWGPMRGFVCADPRLSKPDAQGGSYAAKNRGWTAESLEGHIVEKFFGKVDASESAGWQADVMPVVLSRARIDELVREGHITPTLQNGGGGAAYFSGSSTQAFTDGAVTLPWRLMSARGATNPWLITPGKGAGDDYYVLCVEPNKGFIQELPGHAKPVLFRGFQTVLGMCNPGSKQLGFKACVTADYDLFAVWPSNKDQAAGRHQLMAQIQQRAKLKASLPGNVARLPGIDDRLQKSGLRENFRFGDVSARVLMLKTLLNSAIIGAGGYKGGNAIHHNDEQGNMALAKGSLAECLPVLAFVPFRTPRVIALTTVQDFATLVVEAISEGYDVRAKATWMVEAGLNA
jgi:Anthrax toxin LF subunit